MIETLQKLQERLDKARGAAEDYKSQAQHKNVLADRWLAEAAELEDAIANFDDYPSGTVAAGTDKGGGHAATLVKVSEIHSTITDKGRTPVKESRWVSIYSDFSGSSYEKLADVRERFRDLEIIYIPSS